MLSIETFKHTDVFKPDDNNEDDIDENKYTRIFENEFQETKEEIEKAETEVDRSEIVETSEIVEPNEIVESKEHMDAFIYKLLRCDLYVIGRLWIETLKTILVGAQLRLVPVVHAAQPPPPPTRPPKMRYKDLPIYDSPHYEYKEYEGQKDSCPAAKDKLLHNYLLPYVKQYRTDAQAQLCKMRCMAKKTFRETRCSITCAGEDIKDYMRDPNNIQMRQGLVGTGTLIGWMMGSNLPKKFFFAGLGGLSTGALCFPEETDEVFRNFMANTGNVLVAIYNFYCSKNYVLRGRVPCPEDLPPQPPYRTPQCPKKK